MEKYRTAGRLVILRPCPAAGRLVTLLLARACVTILICCLHGQQTQPLFLAQAPIHGEETSTDPWSYLTRMANFN